MTDNSTPPPPPSVAGTLREPSSAPRPRLGICFSNRGRVLRPSHIARLAGLADELGYDAIFTNESSVDSMCTMTAMAARTGRAQIGSGIVNVYLRHPALLAAGAAAIDDVSGGRLILGLGTGHHWNTEHNLDIPMGKPLSVLREVVTLVRAFLRGEAVHHEGKHYTIRGHKIGFEPLRADLPIYLGVLGLGAAKIAGEIADGVVLNWATVGHVEKAVATIRSSAVATGRSPDAVAISCFLQSFLSEDLEAAWNAARPTVLWYCRMPFYANMIMAAGFESQLRTALAATSDEAALRHIPNELIDALTLCGPLARCRDRLDAYRAAGVDLPIVYPGPVESDWAAAQEVSARAFAQMVSSR